MKGLCDAGGCPVEQHRPTHTEPTMDEDTEVGQLLRNFVEQHPQWLSTDRGSGSRDNLPRIQCFSLRQKSKVCEQDRCVFSFLTKISSPSDVNVRNYPGIRIAP